MARSRSRPRARAAAAAEPESVSLRYVGDGEHHVIGYSTSPYITTVVDRETADGLIETELFEEGEAPPLPDGVVAIGVLTAEGPNSGPLILGSLEDPGVAASALAAGVVPRETPEADPEPAGDGDAPAADGEGDPQ